MILARRWDRGFSIIEGMMAAVIMLVGLLGLASLQVVGVRATHFGKKMALASQLAHDLAQQAERWNYATESAAGGRLISLGLITSTTAAQVTTNWDWSGTTHAGFQYTPEYAEQTDPATHPSALGAWTGLTAASLDPDLHRYWNVYDVDLLATGSAQGKLVQILVVWKEPNLGWRQIASSVYVTNPAAALQ